MRKRQPISLGLYPWIADTVFQIATHANPAVALQFREELLAEKIKPELRERMETHPPRTALLRAQLDDGSWAAGAEDEAEGAGWFTTVRRLWELHDLGVRREAGEVDRAADRLAELQQEDGAFPHQMPHTAFTLWVLATYGLGKAPAAKRAVRYFEKTRRADCGWLDPKLEPVLAANPESPSCPWTTLHVLLALTEYEDQRRNIDVRRGALLVLNRMFKRNHKSFFGHPDHWRELDYVYEGTACFKWAIPKVLLILGRLGCGAETKEVADLLDFLRKTLRPSGRWGATVEGNEFLTLQVLRALMAVQLAGTA